MKWICCLLLVIVSGVFAQTSPKININLGEQISPYAQKYTIQEGLAIPLSFQISTFGDSIEGHCTISVITSSETYTYHVPVELPAHSQRKIVTYIFAPKKSFQVAIFLYQQNQLMAQEYQSFSVILSSSQNIILVANGDESRQRQDHLAIQNQTYQHPISWQRAVNSTTNENLAKTWYAYEAYSCLVIDSHAGVDWKPLSRSQVQALENYVKSGGNLIVCGGNLAIHLQDPYLRSILPVAPSHVQDFQCQNPMLPASPILSLRNSRILPESEVLWQEQDLPILTQRTLDMGRVIFFAGSLSEKNFRSLPQYPPSDPIAQKTLSKSELANYVFSHPANQISLQKLLQKDSRKIERQLTQLSSLPIPSATQIAVYLLIYIISLGLLYVICRIYQKIVTYWILTISLSMFFLFLIYWIGDSRVSSGVTSKVFSIVQSKTQSSSAKVLHNFALFSKKSRNYEFSIDNKNHYILPVSSNTSFSVEADSISVRSSRVAARSSENFSAVGLLDLQQSIVSQLQYKAGAVSGKIINNSSQPLLQTWFVLGDKAAFLGDIPTYSEKDIQKTLQSYSQLKFNKSLYSGLLHDLLHSGDIHDEITQATPYLVAINEESLLSLKNLPGYRQQSCNLFLIQTSITGIKTIQQTPQWVWYVHESEKMSQKQRNAFIVNTEDYTTQDIHLPQWKTLQNPWLQYTRTIHIKVRVRKGYETISPPNNLLIECYNFRHKFWTEHSLKMGKNLEILSISPSQDYISQFSGRLLIRWRLEKHKKWQNNVPIEIDPLEFVID